MIRLTTLALVVCMVLSFFAACTSSGKLTGKWTMDISNYENTCGGETTVAREINLTQSGKTITAKIEVTGDDGKYYTGTFKGDIDKDEYPNKVSLYGKFDVGSSTTEETINIEFTRDTTFRGSSEWTTISSDKSITCKGTQDVKGRKL